MKLGWLGTLSPDFFRSHANRMAACCSTTIQYNTPIIVIPIKLVLSDKTVVDRTRITKNSAGMPNPSESRLFQRSVKKFSFVMLFRFLVD